ncbi:MAG: radical SAM protein [Myxococcota bacterium]
MPSRWDLQEQLADRRADEVLVGPAWVQGPHRMALAYPSPYRAGMSSLGFQWVLRQVRDAGIAAERAFLPDDPEAWRQARLSPCTIESQTPLGDFPIIAISLAYELELAGLVELLEDSGIPPLRKDRGPQHPVILLGGPITFSNPVPAAAFADALLLGEADETIAPAATAWFARKDREQWLDVIEALPGGYVPERHGARLPPVAKATDALLPARSMIWTPHTELSNMFLLEGERGCHRTCTFCVMRRSTNGGMRLVSPERIMDLIPDHAPKVGLVGAAISDHPRLVDLLETIVASGKGVGVSSLRADRVARKPRIAQLLRESGARTLTVASDAASQRLRRVISKGTSEKNLIECARQSGELGFDVLKVYMMVGIPGEEDLDMDELISFTTELAAHSRIALGIAPFVAKRMTPLDGTPFAGIKTVERRLKIIKQGLRTLGGRVDVRATSARWAWVEYVLAQGGEAAGAAVVEAVHRGGRFADYKRAFKALPPSDVRPWVAAGEAPLAM